MSIVRNPLDPNRAPPPRARSGGAAATAGDYATTFRGVGPAPSAPAPPPPTNAALAASGDCDDAAWDDDADGATLVMARPPLGVDAGRDAIAAEEDDARGNTLVMARPTIVIGGSGAAPTAPTAPPRTPALDVTEPAFAAIAARAVEAPPFPVPLARPSLYATPPPGAADGPAFATAPPRPQPPPHAARAAGPPPNLHVTPKQVASVAPFLLGILLIGIDNTIVGTINPTIIAELRGLRLASWIFAGYLLAQTASAPIFGKLSDQFGVKRVYAAGLTVFTAGSMLCGAAQSAPQLVAFRVLQGIGAGAIFPIVLSAVSLRFPPHLRGKLQGYFSALFAFSSVCGPLVGSLVVRFASWRYAFYVNLPVAIVAAALLARYDDSNRPVVSRRIDYVGAALLCAAVTSFLTVFARGGRTGLWLDATNLALAAIAIVSTALLFVVERRAAEPILALPLLASKWAIVSVNALLGALMFGAIFFVPLFVQGATGGATAASGWALLPLMLAMVAGNTLAGRLIHAVGLRPLMMVSMGLFEIGYFLLARMDTSTPLLACIGDVVLVGVGLGIGLVSLIYGMMNGLPPHQLGVGSSSVQFFRNLGGLVGVNLLSTLHAVWFGQGTAGLMTGADARVVEYGDMRSLGRALFSPEGERLLPPSALHGVREAFGHATTMIFAVCSLAAVVGLTLVQFLPKTVSRPGGPPGAGAPPGAPYSGPMNGAPPYAAAGAPLAPSPIAQPRNAQGV